MPKHFKNHGTNRIKAGEDDLAEQNEGQDQADEAELTAEQVGKIVAKNKN